MTKEEHYQKQSLIGFTCVEDNAIREFVESTHSNIAYYDAMHNMLHELIVIGLNAQKCGLDLIQILCEKAYLAGYTFAKQEQEVAELYRMQQVEIGYSKLHEKGDN